MRAVLVSEAAGRAGLYRQQQWMAEVRRRPEAALSPKRYFDIDENLYVEILERVRRGAEAETLEAILGELTKAGAVEILP